jgi:hypothetical protein
VCLCTSVNNRIKKLAFVMEKQQAIAEVGRESVDTNYVFVEIFVLLVCYAVLIGS